VSEGYEAYSEFLRSLVDTEVSRKSSLEQRGIAVITTSGTLATLLYGLTAVVTSSKTLNLPVGAVGWLVASSIVFVLAAMTGVVVNIPLFYGEVELTEEVLRGAWEDSAPDAQAAIANVRISQLTVARRANGIKAWILTISVSLEVVAVGVLSASLFYI
jgi:hypothetical protein